MRYLLESSDYLKVGVEIDADFDKLSEHFDLQFDRNSVLDVARFYDDHEKQNEKHSQSQSMNPNEMKLADLCKRVLGHSIDSNAEIARSEWNAYPLNDDQLRYAAETAHFSLRLFFKIHHG